MSVLPVSETTCLEFNCLFISILCSCTGPWEIAPQGEKLWHLAALRLSQWNPQHVPRVQRPDHVWSRHSVLWVSQTHSCSTCTHNPKVISSQCHALAMCAQSKPNLVAFLRLSNVPLKVNSRCDMWPCCTSDAAVFLLYSKCHVFDLCIRSWYGCQASCPRSCHPDHEGADHRSQQMPQTRYQAVPREFACSNEFLLSNAHWCNRNCELFKLESKGFNILSQFNRTPRSSSLFLTGFCAASTSPVSPPRDQTLSFKVYVCAFRITDE